MAYLYIENFEAGLDTRKSRFTAPAGSLRTFKNAHITRGKEIERRKAFDEIASLPAGTFGLHALNDLVYVFGSEGTPAGMPVTVEYVDLPNPDTADAMTRIWDVENFAGKMYVIAEYANGRVYHFYDGARVADWDTLASDLGDVEAVSAALVYRLAESSIVDVTQYGNRFRLTREPGVSFNASSASANITETSIQAAVPAQSEVRATATFSVTGGSTAPGVNTISVVTVDGTDLIGSPVDYDTDNATTAAAIATRINAGVTEYSATAAAGNVEIEAPAGLGASANGRVLDVQSTGDVTTTVLNNMTGGSDPVEAVAQIDEFEVTAYVEAHEYDLTVFGEDTYYVYGASAAMPVFVKALKQKMYAVTGTLVYFSGFRGTYEGEKRRALASFDVTGGTTGAGNSVESVLAGGLNLLDNPVFFNTNNETTAGDIATAINASDNDYAATQSGSTVNIVAPIGTGAEVNGRDLEVKTTGDVTVGAVDDFSGGFTPARNVALPDPTLWVNFEAEDAYGIGAGTINLSEQLGGTQLAVGLGVYQNRLAVFSRRSIQLWNVDPDPDLNSIYQVLLSVGAVSAKSIMEYGDQDIFFLSETGLRSLRARDSSNIASTSDVGVAIDQDLNDYVREQTQAVKTRAHAILEPLDGRYLLSLGGRVYVFSNFPGSSVNAWSTYELSAGNVDDWAETGSNLFCRIGDSVRQYGGNTGQVYDTDETEVELPFLDAGQPGQYKQITGLDFGGIGVWETEMALEPSLPNERDTVATFNGNTYGSLQKAGALGKSTHVSLRLRTSEAEAAIIGNLIIHYEPIEAR